LWKPSTGRFLFATKYTITFTQQPNFLSTLQQPYRYSYSTTPIKPTFIQPKLFFDPVAIAFNTPVNHDILLANIRVKELITETKNQYHTIPVIIAGTGSAGDHIQLVRTDGFPWKP
jgi:hypothetical protein